MVDIQRAPCEAFLCGVHILCRWGSTGVHHPTEALEQIRRVMWSRRGLGMILHTEHSLVRMRETLDRVVVKVHVGDYSAHRPKRVGVRGEPVVLRGDLDLAGRFVSDRLIRAAMPELELVRPATQRPGQQL